MNISNLVSIIMPTYNRAYIIERAIRSVLNQTYQNWELIIVDDGSTDETNDIVRCFADQRIIYIQNKVNRGANFARNLGVSNASGEFVAFIDSDNYWAINKLELQMKQLEECNSDYFFLYGKVQIMDGQDIRTVPLQKSTNKELKKIELHDNQIDTNTIMLRKDLFQRVEGFDEGMPRLQDWEFALKLLWNYSCEAYFCEEILSYNEIQNDSIGRDQEKYWLGCIYLLEKYMHIYLDENEILKKLVDLQKMFPNKEKEIFELVKKVNRKQSQIAVHMFKEYIKSGSMESLLYLWQMKNNEYNGNVFRKYFYQGSPYQNIAIYGLGNVANLFIGAIRNLPVKIFCGIDKNKREYGEMVVVSPNHIPQVDMIIITVSHDADQIKQELMKITENRIFTLKELLIE